MTTPNPTTPEPAQTSGPQEPPPDDDAAVDQSQEPEQEPATANAEAAKWRTRTRKAEAEIDRLAERVAAYQRRECERLAADLLDEASDLWLFGGTAADFYDGDVLAEDHLRGAIAALLDNRPGLAKTPLRGPLRWGQHGNNTGPAGSADWGQVIKQQR